MRAILFAIVTNAVIFAALHGASTRANEIGSRTGLDPSQQSKVTSALARNRLLSKSTGADANPGSSSSSSSASSGASVGKGCTTDIGNVDLGNQRPGVRAPKDNIVVIKGPIVNGC